jgi:hypothetical protein
LWAHRFSASLPAPFLLSSSRYPLPWYYSCWHYYASLFFLFTPSRSLPRGWSHSFLYIVPPFVVCSFPYILLLFLYIVPALVYCSFPCIVLLRWYRYAHVWFVRGSIGGSIVV